MLVPVLVVVRRRVCLERGVKTPSRFVPGPVMAAAVAVVYLLGVIAALLRHPSCTDPIGDAAPGETLDRVIGR